MSTDNRSGMRAFSELADTKLHWKFDSSSVIPERGDREYVLFTDDEPVASAQAIWQQGTSFETQLQVVEGTYSVTMDLTLPALAAHCRKEGEPTDAAVFTWTHWDFSGSVATGYSGFITTADGRKFSWSPDYLMGVATIRYSLRDASGNSLLSITGTVGGAGQGNMHVSPALAADPDGPALCAVAFTLCNEQALGLHPGAAIQTEPVLFTGRARKPSQPLVVKGPLSILMLGLFVAGCVSVFFSVTIFAICFVAFFALVIILSVYKKLFQ